MSVDLYSYQLKAVDALVEGVSGVLDDWNVLKDSGVEGASLDADSTRFLLHSATGSGKTVMLHSVVSRLMEENVHDVSVRGIVFVLIAPNRLHKQALVSFRDKLGYSSGRLLEVDNLPSKRGLSNGDVLFLNYASNNSETNRSLRVDERGRDLGSVLKLTRESNNVVLIVDEAHVASHTKISKTLFQLINPHAIINATATPEKSDGSFVEGVKVEVKRQDVIDAGQIVESVVFNDSYDKYSADLSDEDNEDYNSTYIYSAVRKLQELEELYKQEGTPVKPLMGVQIPSKTAREGTFTETEYVKDDVNETSLMDTALLFLKKKFGWSVETGEVAIWLANRKENLDDVISFDSPVKVIIFKTAIAVGWDCPRLKVLALLRDNKTKPFTTQTVGRAMRQPENRKYDNDVLNQAYAYTSFDLIRNAIVDVGDGSIKYAPVELPLMDKYVDYMFMNIPNYYNHYGTKVKITDERLYGVLKTVLEEKSGMSFSELVQQKSPKVSLQKLGFEWKLVSQGSHIDGRDRNIDDGNITEVGNSATELSTLQIMHAYKNSVREAVSLVEGAKALSKHVESSLSMLVKSIKKVHPSFNELIFAKIMLHEDGNRSAFFDIVKRLAEEGLKEGFLENTREISSIPTGYEIPKYHSYAQKEEKFKYVAKDHYMYGAAGFHKSALPSREDCDSDGEYTFLTKTSWELISLLKEKGAENIGYFKSGTSNREDLALPYEFEKQKHLFYPDWLFYYTLNGVKHLLIVETKNYDMEPEKTKIKAVALKEWATKLCSDTQQVDGYCLEMNGKEKLDEMIVINEPGMKAIKVLVN